MLAFKVCFRSFQREAGGCLLAELAKKAAVVTLNRPQALNALNMEMAQRLYTVLQRIRSGGEANLVLLKGAGERAFCAGGDVKAIAENVKNGTMKPGDFFKVEYPLDYLTAIYKLPLVALIDGIVMGAGVGVSIHSKFRVATERTVFSMPETAIGFFPDVGGSYFLPKLPGRLGMFLGLTGHRLLGRDVLEAGIATHFVDSKMLPDLESALIDASESRTYEAVLNQYHSKCEKGDHSFTLTPVMKQMEEFFSAKTMEELFGRLRADGSEWAKSCLTTLQTMSPTSLKVTLRQLNAGSKMSLKECLQMEYMLSVRFMQKSDFFEGVRAVLIDKDRKPKWNPSTLEEVSDQEVESYFAPLPNNEQLVLP